MTQDRDGGDSFARRDITSSSKDVVRLLVGNEIENSGASSTVLRISLMRIEPARLIGFVDGGEVDDVF